MHTHTHKHTQGHTHISAHLVGACADAAAAAAGTAGAVYESELQPQSPAARGAWGRRFLQELVSTHGYW